MGDQAASRDGPNTDEALYKPFAEPFIDFGNGYRMPENHQQAADGMGRAVHLRAKHRYLF